MKQHTKQQYSDIAKAESELARALLSMRQPAEALALLRDLCTPAELEAMVDRWRVVPLLRDGLPYRDINQRTGVSVTTVGRIARFLEHGNGGYQLAYERLYADSARETNEQ